jgi:hypothetical protein
LTSIREYLKERCDKYSREFPRMTAVIQMRIIWPRRSPYGRLLWPGQKVTKVRWEEWCMKDALQDASGKRRSSGTYIHWINAYMTDSEFVMAKLEMCID